MLARFIRDSLAMPAWVVERFLEDLSDADLLVRPAEGMNHLAWQLGHLIASEHRHIEIVRGRSMPPLPPGFAERHSKESASSDDPAGFQTKARYIDLMREQRAGTLAVLDSLSDAELQAPPPESLSYFGPSLGCVFSGQASHWMMHLGQWSVVRRQLGKPRIM